MGVRELKHGAKLQEWSARIAECRTSGKSVKAWCNEQGIAIKTYYYWEKKFVTEAIQQVSLPSSRQAGLLMQVNPDAMPGSNVADIGTGVTIHHGESIITLPAGSNAESVAELVKALNRNA